MGAPSLAAMLDFLKTEISLTKGRVQSIANGVLPPKYVRPGEEVRQQAVHDDMRNFHNIILQLSFINAFPTRREIKQFLDLLAANLCS